MRKAVIHEMQRLNDRVLATFEQAAYSLCDGSEGLRLSLVTDLSGGEPETFSFNHPYGERYLYIDGNCNFVSTTDIPGQLLTGTFTGEQAKSIADGLDLEATRGLHYDFLGGCEDSPADIFRTPDAFIRSVCANDDQPALVAAALRWEPVFALAKSVGQPSTGPVTVFVTSSTRSSSAGQNVWRPPLRWRPETQTARCQQARERSAWRR